MIFNTGPSLAIAVISVVVLISVCQRGSEAVWTAWCMSSCTPTMDYQLCRRSKENSGGSATLPDSSWCVCILSLLLDLQGYYYYYYYMIYIAPIPRIESEALGSSRRCWYVGYDNISNLAVTCRHVFNTVRFLLTVLHFLFITAVFNGNTNVILHALSHRTLTVVTLFCLPCRRRSWTGCSIFKMLQRIWSQGPGNTSVVCLIWCMTTCTGWVFLSECSTSLLWQSIVTFGTELHGTSPTTVYQSPKFLVASVCDRPDAIDCQFCKFTAALLGPVHFLSPDQQSGIHYLIICAIQLLTPNNWGLKDVFVRWTFEVLAHWRCLRYCALEIDIYLLTYLLTYLCCVSFSALTLLVWSHDL